MSVVLALVIRCRRETNCSRLFKVIVLSVFIPEQSYCFILHLGLVWHPNRERSVVLTILAKQISSTLSENCMNFCPIN